ncbi:MAG: hypothetical protein K9W43_13460 [Candidatus Thorarchaeota archaeon]|nr:hypothetical protein [Candidatus Thorarchaeota archaeon]
MEQIQTVLESVNMDQTLREKFSKFLHRAQDHIIQLKMIATEGGDADEAIAAIFQESYKAKTLVKHLEKMVEEYPELKQIEKQVWSLDDERARESQAAWLRARKLKIAEARIIRRGTPHNLFVSGTCIITGGRFIYVLTIKNRSNFVVTNVVTTMVAYPRDCMQLTSEISQTIPRINGGDFTTVRFEFGPSKDCVEGKLVCVVNYIDQTDRLRILRARPYVIRSVCDLLQPVQTTQDKFESVFRNLVRSKSEMVLYWPADVLLRKARTILPAINFYLVNVHSETVDDQVIGTITGMALGKYTGKRVGVTITLTGKAGNDETRVKVSVSGDDEAMLPSTIDEIIEKIDSWICLNCGAPLNPEQIMTIQTGSVYTCRYCGASLTLDLYSHSKVSKSEHKQGDFIDTETRTKQPKTGEEIEDSGDPHITDGVSVLRGCEIEGGEFHYKVKIVNNSKLVVTNIVVTIVSYPSDTLSLTSESVKIIKRIEVGGFRSPLFTFAPTKDCVEGKIVASVSLIDSTDHVHTFPVAPYIIRSVCDLLKPLNTAPNEFDKALQEMTHIDNEFKTDWNAQILFERTDQILQLRNFYVIGRHQEIVGDQFIGTVQGFADGKYTGKRVAIVIVITGHKDGNQSTVKVTTHGDDTAMLPITIEEITDMVRLWRCVYCGGELTDTQVLRLRAHTAVDCDHCGRTLTLDLFPK